MFKLSVKLIQWNLTRNRLQLLIMVLAVIGSLSSYVLLGTALNEMSDKVVDVQRSDWPFDIEIIGNIDDEEMKKIMSIPGVKYMEEVYTTEAFVYSSEMEFLLIPKEDTKVIIEMEAGNLPNNANEVAISGKLAVAYQLNVGDRLKVLPGISVLPIDYEISGIVSSKKGVVTKLLLNEEGYLRQTSLFGKKAIQLDGKVDIGFVVDELKKVDAGYLIKKYEENYTNTKNSLGLSDTMVMSLRFLILGITATSLAVLLYIGQRSGAYQTGVLLAMGIKKPWLMLPTISQTTITFLIGFLATSAILPIVSKSLGLVTEPFDILWTLVKDIAVYYGVGMLSTLIITMQFLGTPIPKLLKDS